MYENILNSGVAEFNMPNIYTFLHGSYLQYPDPGLETLLTLGASIETGTDWITADGKESDHKKAAEEYFRRYGEQFGATSGGPSAGPGNIAYLNEAKKSQNIGFLQKDLNYLKDYNEKIRSFPMATTITFSSQQSLNITPILSDTNYDHLIMKYIMKGVINRGETGGLEGFSLADFTKYGQYLESNPDGGTTQVKSYLADRVLQQVPFLGLINYFSGYDPDKAAEVFSLMFPQNTSPMVNSYRFIGKEPQFFGDFANAEETYQATGKIQGFFFNLMSKVIKQKVIALAKRKKRSYADVLKGKPAHSEIIMYRLAKHLIADGQIQPTPIQNIYFSNSNEIKEFVYNDTQVAYGREYKYVVYAYTVVVGMEYKLIGRPGGVGATAPKDGDFYARFYAVTRPAVQLFEVPYYGLEFDEPATALVFDDPPMPPNIDIGGYRGVNNKLAISLSNNFGEVITEPIAIEDGDNVIFSAARMYQSLPKEAYAENKIRFRTDDPSAAFQIFRIGPDLVTGQTKKPTSYSDFKNKRIKTVSYPNSDSATFIDNLRPNTKYYYTFRTIDVHGNISNPTIPYEVEMVSEPGSKLAYVIVREHSFVSSIKPTYKKTMRRFLHIDPREQHKFTNINSIEDIDIEKITVEGFPLGIAQDPLFVRDNQSGGARQKKFKLRLTSKRSGKKVDVNIKFVHKHDKDKKP